MELVSKNENKFSTWRRVGMLAGSIGLVGLLTACGTSEAPSPQEGGEPGEEPTLVAEYYQNGNRILRYENDGDQFADIIASCDGGDMLEQTEFFKHGYGASGGSLVRTVDYPACDDGRLTETDFQAVG